MQSAGALWAFFRKDLGLASSSWGHENIRGDIGSLPASRRKNRRIEVMGGNQGGVTLLLMGDGGDGQ